jgi:thiol-disulfide isomerase/thioredoxin
MEVVVSSSSSAPDKKKNSTKNEKVLVGKIYATWCGHCKELIPKWNQMKKLIKEKYPNRNLVFEEVEQSDMESQLQRINAEHVKDSKQKVEMQEGFPTIFRVSEKGVVQYYGGERDVGSMMKWALGDEPHKSLTSGGGVRMTKRLGGKSNKRKFQKKGKTQKRKRSVSFFQWFR